MGTLLASVVFLTFVCTSRFRLSYLFLFFKLVKGSPTRLCLTKVLTTPKQAKAADQDEFCLQVPLKEENRDPTANNTHPSGFLPVRFGEELASSEAKVGSAETECPR